MADGGGQGDTRRVGKDIRWGGANSRVMRNDEFVRRGGRATTVGGCGSRQSGLVEPKANRGRR
jgi:hypothetical protein